MKKIIIILIVIVGCLAVTGNAQLNTPVGRQLSSLRTACYNFLGEGVADTATIDLGINIGVYETCADFPALEKIDTVVIARTDEGGVLSNDFDRFKERNAVYRLIGDTLRIPLGPLPDSLKAKLPLPKDNTHQKDRIDDPGYYWEHAGRLVLHPKYTKSQADTLLVYYYAYDIRLVATTDSILIKGRYVTKVLDMAFAYILAQAGRESGVALFQAFYRGRSLIGEGQ